MAEEAHNRDHQRERHLEQQVASWARDEHEDELVRERQGTRTLADLVRTDTTFRELLRTTARREGVVEIQSASGRVHLGRIELVAEDHLRVRTARGAGLLAMAAVLRVSERSAGRSEIDAQLGRAGAALTWEHAPDRLLHAIERLVGTEATIRLVGPDQGTEITGEIEAVAQDLVVMLKDPGHRPERTYARFDAVAEVWPFISG